MTGAFDIIACWFDATNNIPESNESNNVAIKSISIAQNIDLTVAASSIRFSNDRPEDGDVITITANAKNAGIVPISNVQVQFYDGPPSTVMPSWPVQTAGSILSSPIFADVDGDRRLEILVGSLDSKLYLLRADGTNYPSWPRTLDGGIYGSPAIGDIDGDAELEVVVGTIEGNIYALNLDGSNVTDSRLRRRTKSFLRRIWQTSIWTVCPILSSAPVAGPCLSSTGQGQSLRASRWLPTRGSIRRPPWAISTAMDFRTLSWVRTTTRFTPGTATGWH
jgi:hypothetical protein